MASTAPPRRFKIEPIETSTKSSKERPQEDQSERPKPIRRFAPEPIETSTKTHRKNLPEPIETTKKTQRRFAPEPIETSSRNSRQKFAEEWQEQTSPSPRRSRPEPVEITTSNNRKPILKRPTKKFAPQLIETAQRSRKASDSAPTLFPHDKTEATPDEIISPRKARILGISPTAPANTPTLDLCQNPLFLEIQRNASPLARRRSYFSSSQHSFRIPNLDPIESSESEASSPPSPTTSPSVTSDHSFMYKEATRRRESVDDRSAGYLLELAAKAAEKQLREQAMAAFPNDDYHEPVDHFVDCDMEDSEPSTDDGKRGRGSSYTEVNWELQAMRNYQEKQEAEKEKQKQEVPASKPKENERPAYNPFGNPAGFLDAATAKKIAEASRDPELERMRKGARPPMLGKDIKFPRCASPEPSRFDPTQGCDAVKTAMCYLSEQSKAASEKGESLWCGKGNGRQTSQTPSLWSNANSRASSTHGLWGGFCVNGGDKSPRGPTGLLTPFHEKPNPLSPCPTPAMSLLPPTPPASTYGITTDFSGIDEKLAIEQTITEEFGDDFVTQVYNYLSLGYPSMARPFDAELSKISKIPVSELRQDDYLAQSRGYIRLGKDGNLTDRAITEETCMRWRALRLYIQEWARQHPKMAEDEFLAGGRGTAVRKGSWAL
ncbi:Nn.00g056370.m01.CDS01 [Neocucurbitaria sp. VM-36]